MVLKYFLFNITVLENLFTFKYLAFYTCQNQVNPIPDLVLKTLLLTEFNMSNNTYFGNHPLHFSSFSVSPKTEFHHFLIVKLFY